ncbi:MAG: glutamate--tRNA ligase [Saprospiraceae bacterium]|nr:glutamate--tRNA ligase [Saprospiraceae bacterium]MBK7809975.1 glutamate--tRNA ligase [Saprospiraceae bacterium]
MRPIRVRFAPSPTGALHIGGIRTALYNYLFAKQKGGTFIIRIEDTDQSRYVPGAEEYILKSLEWLGLQADEGPTQGGAFGPYRQSERKSTYHEYALKLVDQGHAYYAFDSAEELEAMRQRLMSPENPMPKYDFDSRDQMKNSLNLSLDEVQNLLQKNTAHVIRLKVPKGETVKITDQVRGEVSFSTQELDDKILIKSDGMPTYHMANVIDDRLMQISHVIRGEEWLSSTAHHVLLYRYFGWEAEMPEFAHLPLILKPEGNGKLSKRDGAKFGFPVFPMDWKTEEGEVFLGFKEAGFLQEGLINFLVLLGWNPGDDRELFTLEELVDSFSLEKIVKSGARFDFAKAKWFNAHYIQQLEESRAVEIIHSIFEKHGVILTPHQAMLTFKMYRERAVVLTDFYHSGKFIVLKPDKADEEFKTKKWKPEWSDPFLKLSEQMNQLDNFEKTSLEPLLKEFMQTHGLKMGELLPSLRVMISGIPMGPDVYMMLESLGKQETIERIKEGVVKLKH